MLSLTSRELTSKLPAWLRSRMAVLLVGPPGTGKTWTARRVAVQTFGESLVEVLDGGNESAWKALFPYKTPSGALELGMALRASGYVMIQGQIAKAHPGGALVIDEANRVPPELKSPFQLLASERIVPWPEGGTMELDIAIVATANDNDLGVEEASRAELDRYDLTVRLSPTPEEMAVIISGETGLRLEVAQAIYEAVAKLAGRLDARRFHLPEGLRMAISIGRLLRTGTLGPADIYRGAAERCFPLGRRGSERYRSEFDNLVSEEANRFTGTMANFSNITTQSGAPAAAAVSQSGPDPASIRELLATLRESTLAQVTTEVFLPLPRQIAMMVSLFIPAFGLGVIKHLLAKRSPGAEAERAGVQVRFGKDGKPDAIKFRGADRHRVMEFCRLCE